MNDCTKKIIIVLGLTKFTKILLLRSWLYLFCEKHQLHNLCSLFKFDFCLEKTKNCKYSIDTLAYNKHNYLLKFKPFYLNYWSCSPVSKINFVFEQLKHLNYLFKLIWCVVENSEVLLDQLYFFKSNNQNNKFLSISSLHVL